MAEGAVSIPVPEGNSEPEAQEGDEALWAEMAEDVAGEEVEQGSAEEQAPEAPEEPEAQAPAEPEPEAEPEPVAQEPTEPEPEPESQESEGEEVAQEVELPPEPEQEPPSSDDLAAQRQQAFEQLVEKFKLTDEQAEAIMLEPNKVLPQFAASLFLDVYDQVVGAIQQGLPQIVSGILAQQQAATQERQAFFSEWPELAKPEYQETIQRIKESYWQMNPKASPEQAIKEIGAQAWVALRLPLDGLLKRAGVADEAISEPSPEAPPEPKKPANTGGPAYSPPQQKPKNEYELLAEEILAEDF